MNETKIDQKATPTHIVTDNTVNTQNKLVNMSPNSPKTPMTPSVPSPTENTNVADEFKKTDGIVATAKRIGFQSVSKLGTTLQGQIWRAERVNKLGQTTPLVIKITSQFLHQNASAVIDNKLYTVSENIISEQEILKYLTQDKDCPKSIVQFQGFFQTETDYWLVMEDGGMNLFSMTAKVHQLIRKGVIDAPEWHKVVCLIFESMLTCVEYIHSKNVAHGDISLENFLINDVNISQECTHTGEVRKVTFLLGDIQIKLCDFGLAQKFTKSKFLTNKFCGKRQYKSPEVCLRKDVFDARKNDIWCLGMCLFILLTGGYPWGAAHESDEAFTWVQKHGILALLKCWRVDHLVDNHFMLLLESIFRFENDRMTLHNIKKYFDAMIRNK